MFTGIVEDVGEIITLRAGTLAALTRLDGITAGDSIAVNGVCLTATRILPSTDARRIEFDFSPETARLTGIGALAAGSSVNLERALRVGDRLGGHFLSGHIDGQGKLTGIERQGNSYLLTVTLPVELGRYVIKKGSIGVDGISLTIAERTATAFSAAVIPHTYNTTNLRAKKRGDTVNIETDMLAKYIESLFGSSVKTKGITGEFLKENGYY